MEMVMARQDFVRARQPDQKAQRKQQFLTAAAKLLERGGLDEASLSEIAREAGIAKSNIYRYFESREEILLTLLLKDYLECNHRLIGELSDLEGTDDIDAVANLLGVVFCDFPRLWFLMGLLESVLSRNISVDRLAQFNEEVELRREELCSAMLVALPSMDEEHIKAATLTNTAFIIGLWQMAQAESSNAIPEKNRQAEFQNRLQAGIKFILTGAFHQRLSTAGK